MRRSVKPAHTVCKPRGGWDILPRTMEIAELSPGFGRWMSAVTSDATGRVWGIWSPGGCWSSPDRGVTWGAHPITPRTRGTALAAGPDGRIYVGSHRGEVFESLDGGMTWICHTLPGMAAVQRILATRRGVLAVGARLYRRPGDDLAWLTGPPRSPTVTAVAASEDGVVYAGLRMGVRGWIARSDDGGARWKEQWVLPGRGRVVNALAASGDNVYAAVADVTRWGAAESEGLRSADGGETWTTFMFPADPRQRVSTLWAAGEVVYGYATGFDLETGGPARDAVLMRSADGCRRWEAELHDGEQALDAAGGVTGDVWFAQNNGRLLKVSDPAVSAHVAARFADGAGRLT